MIAQIMLATISQWLVKTAKLGGKCWNVHPMKLEDFSGAPLCFHSKYIAWGFLP